MSLDTADVSRNSKWSEIYFRTNAQQILTASSLEDIGDKDIVAHWPAGEDADNIIVFNKATGEKVTEYALTESDKTNGRARVASLQPETEYTLKLYCNNKERGSKSFKTIADLSGATIVRSTDNFSEMLENATAHQIFALYNGTYKISAGAGEDAPVLRSSTKILPLRAFIQPQSPKYKDDSKWKTVLD